MNVLCIGGGTLGSVSPLLAVAEDARERKAGHDVRFWGTASGPERAVVEAAGFKFTPVFGGKLRRYFSWQNFAAPLQTFAGVVQAWQQLGKWRPDVLLAAGSYVAVPGVWAAWLRRIPVVVHHQDVDVGLANRLMFPFSRAVTTVFPVRPGLPKRAVVTGNPVRRPFLQPWTAEAKASVRLRLGLDGDKPVLVVVGGSGGASGLNNLVVHSLPLLLE
jgi:UDP-N-acetylglucosamine--N-acetylmuramyl-(pentapeptide) pyrophosphoryl-undecaprenol N-acetylglucosamine transferase